MSDRPFVNGANVIIKVDGEKIFGMTCAWACQVDYSKALMLIGSQSETGKHLKVGDIVSVSGLASSQKEIGETIGTNHSSANKFKNIELVDFNGVKAIKGAKTISKCKIIDIMHLKGIEEDNLVYLDILNFKDDPSKDFITYKDFE